MTSTYRRHPKLFSIFLRAPTERTSRPDHSRRYERRVCIRHPDIQSSVLSWLEFRFLVLGGCKPYNYCMLVEIITFLSFWSNFGLTSSGLSIAYKPPETQIPSGASLYFLNRVASNNIVGVGPGILQSRQIGLLIRQPSILYHLPLNSIHRVWCDRDI